MRHETGTGNAPFAKQGAPRVIVGAPELINPADMSAMKEALQELGAIVSAFRADIFYHSEQFETACKSGTHLVLFVDNDEFLHERRMLAVAVKIPETAIICLGSCDALKRHARLFTSGRARLVVTRSYSDNARKTAVLGVQVPYAVVAEDLVKSAGQIARAILAGWR